MPATLQDIVAAVTSDRGGSAALEYKKGDHATGEGDRYEERVLALVFLRCLRRGLIFQLSANNGDAGKFDDVVLVWRAEEHPEAHALLVQLKHKTSSNAMTLRSSMWLPRAPNGDFALSKYCTSYEEISEKLEMERVTYILLTNAHLGKSSLSLFLEHSVGTVPGLELLQAGGDLYKLDANNQQVLEAVRGNTNFVNNFYLLCGQSNSVDVVGDIRVELEELLGAGELCRSICDRLCFSMREWMNSPQGVCLTSGWSKWQELVDDYVRKYVTECRAVTTRLTYCSVAAVQSYVQSRNPAWVRPPEKGSEALSATKVHQALAGQTHIMVPGEWFAEQRHRFSQQRHRVLRCWGPFCRWLVIVDTDAEGHGVILDELLNQIIHERRLIIVSSREDSSFVDSCHSSDVSDDSWEELLDVSVRLNGERYECRLRDLVAGLDGLKSLLDGQPALLLALARLSQPLRMGQQLETLPEYYVPREVAHWRLLTDGFFLFLGRWDVCVTDTASYEQLTRLLGRHSVMSLEEVKTWLLVESEIEWPLFVLTDEMETIQEMVSRWTGLNTYTLQVCNDRWKMLYCFGHRDRDAEYALQQEEEQLDALHSSSNVVIVEGRPGVGKSKLLSHVAEQIKERDPACWILRVNLLEFYTVLDESASGVTAVEDILKETVCNKDELGRLEYALLRRSLLDSPRVVCLVDGFDEVCPDYVDRCLEVLPLLAPRHGKLLVTTRPGAVKTLEARMGVLAHSLEPFSDSEVEAFFRLHSSRGKIPPVWGLNKSLRKLLRIPLFAEMLLTVSEEMGETYDVVTLYEAFFQKKFLRFYKEKWGDNLSAPGKKREVKAAQKRHEQQLMLLAASVLLRSTEVPALPQLDTDYFVKSGIVYKFTSGKPIFLHRTFAEHFLAKWCFLADEGRSRAAAVYREAFRGETLEFFLESFDRTAVRGRPLLEAALQALLGGDVGNVATLLASGANLGEADALGRNALHLAAAYGPRRSLPLLRQLRAFPGLGALSVEDGLLGWTPMRYAVESGRWLSVQQLVDAGGDLAHLDAFLATRHDAAELQAVFRRGGYRALYQHVFQGNHPSLQTPEDRLWEDRSTTSQIEFTVSVMSANVERESLKLIGEEAGQEGHSIVRTLLLCACFRKEQEEMLRQKEEAIEKGKYFRPKRWRYLGMAAETQSASAETAVKPEVSRWRPNGATEVPECATSPQARGQAGSTACDSASAVTVLHKAENKTVGGYSFQHHFGDDASSSSSSNRGAMEVSSGAAPPQTSKQVESPAGESGSALTGLPKVENKKVGGYSFQHHFGDEASNSSSSNRGAMEVPNGAAPPQTSKQVVSPTGESGSALTGLQQVEEVGGYSFQHHCGNEGSSSTSSSHGAMEVPNGAAPPQTREQVVSPAGDSGSALTGLQQVEEVGRYTFQHHCEDEVSSFNSSSHGDVEAADEDGVAPPQTMGLAQIPARNSGSALMGLQKMGNHRVGRYSFLHHCAATGKSRILRGLIDSGRDVDEWDEQECTALHHAASCGNAGCVSLLVAAGADVSARCEDFSTPLHWAAMGGHADCVRLLLESGADVEERNLRGCTALTYAAKCGSDECVRLLEAAAADRQSRRSVPSPRS